MWRNGSGAEEIAGNQLVGLCTSRASWSRLFRAVSTWGLNTSTNVDSGESVPVFCHRGLSCGGRKKSGRILSKEQKKDMRVGLWTCSATDEIIPTFLCPLAGQRDRRCL